MGHGFRLLSREGSTACLPVDDRRHSWNNDDVYRLARRRGLAHEDAEDIAQDARLRLWQAGPQPFEPRLRGCISKRAVASFLRHEFAEKRDRRRLVRLDASPLAPDPTGDEAHAEGGSRRLLDLLTRNQEGTLGVRVLRLRLEGNSYRTIAARVGRRIHDVTNCLHRMKKMLRARLAGLSLGGA